jgi:hypothetical protein
MTETILLVAPNVAQLKIATKVALVIQAHRSAVLVALPLLEVLRSQAALSEALHQYLCL